ncbi:MAG: T9SS type A sorting domain-containing protein, partial [Bacteroidales bacterium]|nr:T9SS type A sorting domain-containing protein [Bacteroidales bacterium]
STNGFVASTKTRYNALRSTILNTDYIMKMVQNQYNDLVEIGAYDREHEAWPTYSVNEGQLCYMRSWLDDRFNYLDGEINAPCGTWGIEDHEPVEGPTQFVEVFPNPTKDCINVRFVEAGEAVVNLYDMTGRLVYSNSGAAQAMVIPTQGFVKGVYTLVINALEQQQVSRVVVE